MTHTIKRFRRPLILLIAGVLFSVGVAALVGAMSANETPTSPNSTLPADWTAPGCDHNHTLIV